MNEQIIDSQDSVEMKSTRKPLHLSIVSIGAFLLISLVLIIMMDMFITALAENLAISHAGVGATIEDAAVETYVIAVRSTAIICLAASIAIGLFWRKIYLHKPGRILQKLLMLTISFMIIVMFGNRSYRSLCLLPLGSNSTGRLVTKEYEALQIWSTRNTSGCHSRRVFPNGTSNINGQGTKQPSSQYLWSILLDS